MSIKSTIAAVAASPFLLAGAAFAGPYVNIEANGSYPAGEYAGGNIEAQVGYEGTTEGGLNYYASVGPTIPHTDNPTGDDDKFGDVEIAGYLGGTYDKFYGEIYGVTNEDDIDFSGKVGVKFTF